MIYTVTAVIFLHIISLPIVFSVRVDADSDKGFGTVSVKLFFITVFKRSLDVDALKNSLFGGSQADDEKRSNDDATDGKRSKLKAYAFASAKRALLRLRVRELTVNVRIGTGNAAASAMTVGALRVAFNRACTVLGYVGDAEIEPDYGAEMIRILFSGIFSLCIADIIYAACGALRDIAGKKNKRTVASTT